MRTPNPELERRIRQAALGLLMEKEPAQVGMREVADRCGVTATTIYYYYADKDSLFEAIKLEALVRLEMEIRVRVAEARGTRAGFRAGLEAFRDWSFANPRLATLVMGRLKANEAASPDEMRRYNACNDFAKGFLDGAVSRGEIDCADTALESALCVAGVWGAIEMILEKRTLPEFWDRGIHFTDRMIDRFMPSFRDGGSDDNGNA